MSSCFIAPKYKLIYVFAIADEAHEGCLKVGETSAPCDPALPPNSHALNQAARERINQYTQTAGISYTLLHTELALRAREGQTEAFSDKEVHGVLLRSGIARKDFGQHDGRGTEWFVTDLTTVRNAIAAAKQGRKSLLPGEVSEDRTPIVFRPEQEEAITRTAKRFRKKNGTRMLWNAKMRFGKTLCALEVIKRMQYRRTIILTHRPVVDDQWFKDFGKIFIERGTPYIYGSKGKGDSLDGLPARLAEGKSIVYFASMQDLRGSAGVGGKFDKNHWVFATGWDMVIVDEAHEGTQTDLGQAVLSALVRRDTRMLSLSGTPFNLLDDYNEDEIYTWDYVMEQRAKAMWDATHCGDHNPYADLPQMNIYTYNLGALMSEYADEEVAFNFREFFRVDDNEHFVHKADVVAFLNLLAKDDPDSCYPFANPRYRTIFRHTLWMVPGVAAARALSELLHKHPVFGQFGIVNVAGEGDDDEKANDALQKVQQALGPDADDSYTITLSCGRLTTGVSVPEWTGVLMLSGSYATAASSYMQTIFRVQTPWTHRGHVKEDAYVFDFAPDRTLTVLATVARVSTKAGKTSEEQRQGLGDFLNFCPVISIEGSQMKAFDTHGMLQQLKRAYVERVVRSGFEDQYLYTDDLMKLTDVDVREFEKLKGIIGQTQAMASTGNIKINDQGLTNEQYEQLEQLEGKKKKAKRELTAEELKRLEELRRALAQKRSAVSILRGISVRMPLLIYGAKVDDEHKDLTIANFTRLVDDKSWAEFMPAGVTKHVFGKFLRYYDPEVFAAAGQRIRAMARAADRLPVEQRIERITDIFATFKNPDKETVLTPWRVVNMHVAETLGGYCFHAEDFRTALDAPRYVDRGKVTDQVFDTSTRLLEINSKSGLYPLLLAYNVWRRRLKDSLFAIDEREAQQALWDRVLRENIFVICKTPMAKAITRRTLCGFRDVPTNMWAPDDLLNKVKNEKDKFINTAYTKLKLSKKMKFNAIVGNPPYQETVAQKETTNGQKVSMSIFQHFQEISDRMGFYTALIYPGKRWIHRSGKGMELFGLEQINDRHLAMVQYFPVADEVFDSVGIADGLTIVMKDMRKTAPGFQYIYRKGQERISVHAESPGDKLLPLNPKEWGIAASLDAAIAKYGCLHDSVLSQKLFSIESDFVERNPDKVRPYDSGDLFNPDTEIKLLTNDKAGKSGRSRWYVADRSVITTGLEELDRWKVIVSSANAGGQKRANQLEVLDDHSAFGRSRVALKTFATRGEAENFARYVGSEVVRFALLLTDEALTSLAKKVPDLMDYADGGGLVDWHAADLDAQLYALFGIAEADIPHIRATLAQQPG